MKFSPSPEPIISISNEFSSGVQHRRFLSLSLSVGKDKGKGKGKAKANGGMRKKSGVRDGVESDENPNANGILLQISFKFEKSQRRLC